MATITKDNIAQMGLAGQQAQAGMQSGKGSGGAGGPAPAHAPVWMGGMQTGKGGGTDPMQAGKGANQSAMAANMQQQLNPVYARLQSMGGPTPNMSQSAPAPAAAPPPAATSGLAPLPPAASQLRPQQAVPFTKEEATRMMSGPVAREPALSIPQQKARSSGAANDIFKMFLPENQSRVSIKRGGSR